MHPPAPATEQARLALISIVAELRYLKTDNKPFTETKPPDNGHSIKYVALILTNLDPLLSHVGISIKCHYSILVANYLP